MTVRSKGPKGFPPLPDNAENPLTESGIQLGEKLFFDVRLSADESMSCATCHQPEYAFSGGPVTANAGITGQLQSRNTPPLFNLAWYETMAWDGRSNSIEEHLHIPILSEGEMGGSWQGINKRLKADNTYSALSLDAFGKDGVDSTVIVKAIAQYLRTLISADSKYDKAIRGELFLDEDELAGLELVNDQVKAACLHCHVTDAHVLGTNGKMSVNGLAISGEDRGRFDLTGDSSDIGRYKTPSLRNLRYTAPYMHDGRFETLEEVLDFYNEDVQAHPGLDSKFAFARKGLGLSGEEKRQIIAFLDALNDESFVDSGERRNR